MELDDTDKGILFLLQRDARNATTQEMAEKVGVSASTVRNRIERLEEAGIVRGYYPDVDYDEAGLQLHIVFICSAPASARGRTAKAAYEVKGVVTVTEVLNGTDNVHVEAVGTETDDIARINDELSDAGFEVLNSKIVKSKYVQPFDHFGENVVEDDQS